MPAVKHLAAAVVLAGLTVAGASASLESRAAPKTRPNVIVIETDDQTVEQMRVMTKTLDLIGRRGTTFDNSFVSLSLCCPSRATFLTGQYAHNNGVMTNKLPYGGYELLDGTNTLPVWLQQAGYTTAFVGKYLNGYPVAGAETEIPPGWSEWHAGVTLPYYDWTLNDNGSLVRYGSSPGDYQTNVFTAKAVEVIERQVPEASPLFMWVSYHAPHAGGPAEPGDPSGIGTANVGPKYGKRFASEPLPVMPSFNEADVSDKPIGIRRRPLLTPAKTAAIQEAYQQQLEALLYVDDGVGAIVDALRRTGELANTLLIFTNDNGFFHGEHRVPSGKVLVYEPSIRVPLLMRGPGIPKDKHLPQLVSNADLAPTIADVAGAEHGLVMDGRSLLPLFRKPGTLWGRDLLIERGPSGAAMKGVAEMGEIGNGDDGNQGKTAVPGDRRFAAVRTPRFLYARYANGEKELYDLAADPDELVNLASKRGYRALRTDLAHQLTALRNCKGSKCRRGPRVWLTRRKCIFKIKGPDKGLVTEATFLVSGRRVAWDAQAPFSADIRARKGARVTARVGFLDGRGVVRDRPAGTGCR